MKQDAYQSCDANFFVTIGQENGAYKMNDLEEKLIQYEKDAIAYETGKSGAAPSMFIISPNELLILLNEKNAEIAQILSEFNRLRECELAYQLAVAEAVKATGERNQLQAELTKARKVIEQVKHDGDTFDHLRGFAGYIKAANYLVGEKP
jgi:hypothetical protein